MLAGCFLAWLVITKSIRSIYIALVKLRILIYYCSAAKIQEIKIIQ